MKTKLTKNTKNEVLNFSYFTYKYRDNLNTLFLANNSMSMSMSVSNKS